MKQLHLYLITFGVLLVLMHCEDSTMSLTIQEVKSKHEDRILSLPGVVSVGIGRNPDGASVIIIGLDGPRPDTVKQLPKVLDGYPVRIEITGHLKAL
jgi:hypothetical protein